MFEYPEYQYQEYYDLYLENRIKEVENNLTWDNMIKLFRDEYVDVNNKFMSTKLRIDSPKIYNAIHYWTHKIAKYKKEKICGIPKIVDLLCCDGTTNYCDKGGEMSVGEYEEFNSYLTVKFGLHDGKSYGDIAKDLDMLRQKVWYLYNKKLKSKFECR